MDCMFGEEVGRITLLLPRHASLSPIPIHIFETDGNLYEGEISFLGCDHLKVMVVPSASFISSPDTGMIAFYGDRQDPKKHERKRRDMEESRNTDSYGQRSVGPRDSFASRITD